MYRTSWFYELLIFYKCYRGSHLNGYENISVNFNLKKKIENWTFIQNIRDVSPGNPKIVKMGKKIFRSKLSQ